MRIGDENQDEDGSGIDSRRRVNVSQNKSRSRKESDPEDDIEGATGSQPELASELKIGWESD